ncbi:MAG: hypothetical protein V4514_17850 [Pseudomonadota bacterium]
MLVQPVAGVEHILGLNLMHAPALKDAIGFRQPRRIRFVGAIRGEDGMDRLAKRQHVGCADKGQAGPKLNLFDDDERRGARLAAEAPVQGRRSRGWRVRRT